MNIVTPWKAWRHTRGVELRRGIKSLVGTTLRICPDCDGTGDEGKNNIYVCQKCFGRGLLKADGGMATLNEYKQVMNAPANRMFHFLGLNKNGNE